MYTINLTTILTVQYSGMYVHMYILGIKNQPKDCTFPSYKGSSFVLIEWVCVGRKWAYLPENHSLNTAFLEATYIAYHCITYDPYLSTFF